MKRYKMKTDNKKEKNSFSLLPSPFSLENKKILLAFSAGVDSTALFFLLHENDIKCDLAIVDFGLREQSKEEVAYAKELAGRYGCQCYVAYAPKFTAHFEENARKFRYGFFEELINEHKYDVLLTAHQLNDRLEWLLMRLTKGAGASELVGLKSVAKKRDYMLVRPLLEYSKDELKSYLDKKGIKYFFDDSNYDEGYERNYFRHNFSDLLIEKYKDGIKRSFEYLKNDAAMQESMFDTVYSEKELMIVELKDISFKTKAADLALKELGYLLSRKQRAEIQENKSIVVGGEWVVALEKDLLFIAPYKKTVLPKEFKEFCRIRHIPPLARGYIYDENINLEGVLDVK